MGGWCGWGAAAAWVVERVDQTQMARLFGVDVHPGTGEQPDSWFPTFTPVRIGGRAPLNHADILAEVLELVGVGA